MRKINFIYLSVEHVFSTFKPCVRVSHKDTTSLYIENTRKITMPL